MVNDQERPILTEETNILEGSLEMYTLSFNTGYTLGRLGGSIS